MKKPRRRKIKALPGKKGQRNRQESTCRKGNRKEKIRKKIHEMSLVLQGFVWTLVEVILRRAGEGKGLVGGTWVPRALP